MAQRKTTSIYLKKKIFMPNLNNKIPMDTVLQLKKNYQRIK